MAPLTEAASGPKGRKILWNNALESSFKELKLIVSSKKLLMDPDWKIPSTFPTNDDDKQLGAVIIQKKNILPYSQED